MATLSSLEPTLVDRPQIPALTGLRFLAALFVMVGHLANCIVQFPDSNAWAPALASLGMSLFFVLSGFVIYYNYTGLFQKEPFCRALYSFLVNRFARLYPLYFCYVFVAMAIDPNGPLLGDSWIVLPPYLTLSQSWAFASLTNGSPMLARFFPPSWSISVECFFYLLFPAVALSVVRLKRPRAALLVWLAALAGGYVAIWMVCQIRFLLFSWACILTVPDPTRADHFFSWLSYFCPLVRFLEFLLGCLTAHLYLTLRDVPRKRWEKPLGIGVLLLCLVVMGGLGWVFMLPFHADSFYWFLRTNFLFAGPVALVIFCSLRYPSVLTRWLDWRPVLLLGEASYSIYLSHIFLVMIFIKPSTLPFTPELFLQRLFAFAVAVAFVFIFSIGTYRLIEIPTRRWLRAFLGRLPSLSFGNWALGPGVLAFYLIPLLGLGSFFFLYRTSYFPTLLFSRAEESQEKGRRYEALTNLNRLIQMRPYFGRALCLRAQIHLAMDNPHDALADLERARRVRALDARALYHRGKAHLLLGDPQAAEADLTRAITIQPDLVAAYQLRGQLRKSQGDHSGASADFQQTQKQ